MWPAESSRWDSSAGMVAEDPTQRHRMEAAGITGCDCPPCVSGNEDCLRGGAGLRKQSRPCHLNGQTGRSSPSCENSSRSGQELSHTLRRMIERLEERRQLMRDASGGRWWFFPVTTGRNPRSEPYLQPRRGAMRELRYPPAGEDRVWWSCGRGTCARRCHSNMSVVRSHERALRATTSATHRSTRCPGHPVRADHHQPPRLGRSRRSYEVSLLCMT